MSASKVNFAECVFTRVRWVSILRATVDRHHGEAISADSAVSASVLALSGFVNTLSGNVTIIDVKTSNAMSVDDLLGLPYVDGE